MSNYWRGVAYSLMAAFFWAVMSPIAKVLSAAGIHLISVMAFRGIFVAATMAPWLYFMRGKAFFFPPRSELIFYLNSGMLSVVLAGGGFLMSLAYLSVAEALILHYTFPLVTMLGSMYITHEKPSPIQIIAGFMIIAGVYSGMVGGDKTVAGMSIPGVFWGAVAVLGISGQAILARLNVKKHQVDAMGMLFFGHLIGGIVLIALKSFFIGWNDLNNFTYWYFTILLLQAFSGSLIAYGLFYSALKIIPAATVSLLCSLEMVIAVILTAMILGIIPSIQEIFGCVIIILAIVLVTFPSKRNN